MLFIVAGTAGRADCGRSVAGVAGSNPVREQVCLSVVSVVCCQLHVSATSLSIVQRSPTDSGASFCVIRNLEKEIAIVHLGPQRHREKETLLTT